MGPFKARPGIDVSRQRHRSHSLLVVGQMAMALLLMASAGLMIRTFHALRTIDPDSALRSIFKRCAYPFRSRWCRCRAVIRTQNDIFDRLAGIPGVTSVAYAGALPLEKYAPGWDSIFAEGKTYPSGELPPLRLFEFVSPDLFHTMGTRLVAGRDLNWTDIYAQRKFALVSENLARELWGTPAAALNKRFRELPSAPGGK